MSHKAVEKLQDEIEFLTGLHYYSRLHSVCCGGNCLALSYQLEKAILANERHCWFHFGALLEDIFE